MTPLEGARAWVAAWQAGWSRHDPGVIAERYTVDCRFRSEPFRDTWTELEGDHGVDLVKEAPR